MTEVSEHQYEYENEDSISRHLKCLLCKRPFVQPVSVRCMNKQLTYCRCCIEEWINIHHTCPTCEYNLDLRNLTPVSGSIVTNILDDLPVKCLKCEQTHMSRSSFFSDHHQERCTLINTDLLSNMTCDLNNNNEQSQAGEHQTERTIERLQYENQQLRMQLDQRDNEIVRFQNENDNLRDQLYQQRVESRTFQNENQRLKLQVDNQQSRIDELVNTNEQLKNRISAQGTEIEDLQRENQNLRNQLDEQTIQIQRLQNENEDLRKQLEVQMGMIETQRNEIQKLKEEMETKNNETQRRFEQLEARLNEQQNENREVNTNRRQARHTSGARQAPPAPYENSQQLVDDTLDDLYKRFRPPPNIMQTIDAFKNYILHENSTNNDQEVGQSTDQQPIDIDWQSFVTFAVLQILIKSERLTDNERKYVSGQNSHHVAAAIPTNTARSLPNQLFTFPRRPSLVSTDSAANFQNSRFPTDQNSIFNNYGNATSRNLDHLNTNYHSNLSVGSADAGRADPNIDAAILRQNIS